MIIEINKDIESYKESVFFGLSAKQTLSAVLTVLIGGGTVFLLHPVLGLKLSAYIAVPIAAPVALSGFYTMNGMCFFEVWKRRITLIFFNKGLSYRTSEEKLVTHSRNKKSSPELKDNNAGFVERKRR